MAEEYNHNRLIGGSKWWDSSAATTATSSSLSTLQMMNPQGHDLVPGSGFRSSMYGSDQTPMKGFSLDQFSHTSSVDSCGGLASESPAAGMFQVFMEPPPLLQSTPGYGGYINNQPGSDSLMGSNNFNWNNNKIVQETTPQFFRPQQQQPQFFNNGGCFWETAAANSVEEDEARPALFFPVEPPMAAPATFHDKHHHKNNTMAVKSTTTGAVRKSSLGSNRTTTTATASTTTTGGGAAKRSRNEASSTMPPFKVRKEKMGDRITALQQLVSPFGKTDTASVLSESIEYIKFLHEQVNVLSTPYLKSGASLQLQQQSHNVSKDLKKDLRSRGLCLVPVSSTFPVAHESAVDFWTPTFGSGTFR